jgi:hypothetical protein
MSAYVSLFTLFFRMSGERDLGKERERDEMHMLTCGVHISATTCLDLTCGVHISATTCLDLSETRTTIKDRVDKERQV